MAPMIITHIGGPTALIEFGGFRLLTDPTFDPPGEYELPHVTLTKTSHPALAADAVGRVDAVLLSHDQHADNLDRAGRAYIETAERTLTTRAGAERLGGQIEGLAPWESTELTTPDGARLQIIATPARHGPAGIEPLSGDVIGFVLGLEGRPEIYVTGDTVWCSGTPNARRGSLIARTRPDQSRRFAPKSLSRAGRRLGLQRSDRPFASFFYARNARRRPP